ncbi:hypothetical protein D3C80_1326410 [compost metagenome]
MTVILDKSKKYLIKFANGTYFSGHYAEHSGVQDFKDAFQFIDEIDVNTTLDFINNRPHKQKNAKATVVVLTIFCAKKTEQMYYPFNIAKAVDNFHVVAYSLNQKLIFISDNLSLDLNILNAKRCSAKESESLALQSNQKVGDLLYYPYEVAILMEEVNE